MGDLNSGGGGSVLWHINVKNQKPVPPAVTKDDGRFHIYGADEGGKKGQHFTVRIKLQQGETLDAFKAKLKKVGNKVVFTVPISTKKDLSQIHIHWPDKGKAT
jgi:dihydroxyacetone kinase-like predicted kinase